ncbi:uncharacterized protein ACO6RY_15196 [Pungitius sinensis]
MLTPEAAAVSSSQDLLSAPNWANDTCLCDSFLPDEGIITRTWTFDQVCAEQKEEEEEELQLQCFHNKAVTEGGTATIQSAANNQSAFCL